MLSVFFLKVDVFVMIHHPGGKWRNQFLVRFLAVLFPVSVIRGSYAYIFSNITSILLVYKCFPLLCSSKMASLVFCLIPIRLLITSLQLKGTTSFPGYLHQNLGQSPHVPLLALYLIEKDKYLKAVRNVAPNIAQDCSLEM